MISAIPVSGNDTFPDTVQSNSDNGTENCESGKMLCEDNETYKNELQRSKNISYHD